MKVIQVMPEFKLAGAEIMCEKLSYALQKLGVEVTIVSLYDCRSPITARLEAHGLPVIYLGKKRGFDASMVPKLRKIFREIQPDAVHTHLYVDKYAVPAAVLSGVPKVVHTVHNLAAKETTAAGKLLNQILFRMHRVIPVALSEQIQRSVISCYGLDREKVPTVCNGVPLENCLPKQDYTVHSPVQLLHVGRLTRQKNQPELLRAVRTLLDKGLPVNLTIIGDGDGKEALYQQIREEGMAEVVRHIPQTDNVYPYLHDADIFVLPSLYEGLPMSVIEAMGTALPIVASAVGGVPDMIADGRSGLLCAPDAHSIATCLERMIENYELRASCGKAAKIEAERFSAQQMAENYREIYRRFPLKG